MSAWHAQIRATLGSFTLDVSIEGVEGTLALIGPNGSGKTTFLRAITGAIHCELAEITVGERTLASKGVELPVEQRRVGYVPQGYALFPHLSALENVAFGSDPQKARSLLDELGCGELADRRIVGLSGGEKQRVALARALASEPDILLLDEPLAALDAVTRRRVRDVLSERLRAFDQPAVIVTHDVRDVEALEATVCALDAGHVAQMGSLQQLRDAPATEFVAAWAL